MRTLLITILAFAFVVGFTSCKKYLDAKPDKSISTPSTLSDLDGMINYYFGLNQRYPSAGEICADNYYLTDAGWAATSELHRNYYTWQKYDLIRLDWSAPYACILQANVILEALSDIDIKSTEQQKADEIRGSALFIRAYYHHALAQLFAPTYNTTTAATDLGIPLRLNSDATQISVRASIEENYNSILSDLKTAIPLLPAKPLLKYRPSRPAAYATLARTYLVMQQFEKAGLYADSCLRLYDTLMNYNSLNASATIPFAQFNKEVIYDVRTAAPSALAATRAKVDTLLYNSYENNDIRKTIFFRANSDGSRAFKGNYTGQSNAALFTGIATDELFLIRAEAFARGGNLTAALADINRLLKTRWKEVNGVSTYIDKTAGTPQQTLELILWERRKELLYRTLRWSDLRRLNTEALFAVTLIRKLNGQVFELSPGSPRYTLPIDRDAVNLSGMPQNP